MVRKGLFASIRDTPFVSFVLYWLISIFVFTLIYFFLSSVVAIIYFDKEAILFNLSGLALSLYASFSIGTIFGFGRIAYAGIVGIAVYIQFILSIIVLLILVDKLVRRYLLPHYHAVHRQDKRINTTVLMMSIFRHDIDSIKTGMRSKQYHDLEMKDIESAIDGLYIAFLDIDKIFSVRNMHRHRITDRQHVMVIASIEESLRKLSGFIEFLEGHSIVWKDKNVAFWVGYVVEIAEKIVVHFDDIKVRNPRLTVSLENIADLASAIEKKI